MGHENRFVSSKYVVGGGEGVGGGCGSLKTAHIHRMEQALLCRDTVSAKLPESVLLVNRCLHD
jgi:hypothetical protein